MKEKEFYYTDIEMVKDLLSVTPIFWQKDIVLDAGSGNGAWYHNLLCPQKNRRECEIERGNDFYKWEEKVDWIVGNPPFRHNGENQIWKWIDKASQVANTGMAFLLNHKVFNTLTPVRLQLLADRGFYIQKIRIVADKRWFGRYYYLIFGRENKNLISWKK